MGLLRFIGNAIIDYGVSQNEPNAIWLAEHRKKSKKKKKKTRVSEQDGELETWVASLDE